MKRYIKAMTEEEQLNWAIENGKPFDLDTFNKYKVDPYREPDAIQAKDIQIGDFIRVTESADEVDLNTIVEIYDIDYNDPDGYNFLHNGYRTAKDDVITFICKDRRGRRMPYNLHFWPDEYVGVKIGHQAKLDPNDFIGSAVGASTSDHHMQWNEPWRPYSGSESVYQTLYVDGKEVGYIESYDIDGQHETIAFIKADPTEYEESLGTFRSEADAKDKLESEIRRVYDLVDTFPVTSATAEDADNDECINSGSCVNCESDVIKRYSDVRPYEDRRYWYFTTHGIGPGTIPKDLNVLETREGQNDKGTRGTYICLDGVLNTDELNYYDLRELAPDNINSAEDIEIEESFDGPKPGHILWNISWWDQRGNQCGENLELPKDEEYPGIAIERYLSDKYGDEYGGVADFMGFDDEGNYITGAEEIDEFDEIDDMNDALDEWDPYHGLNYRVDGNSSQKIEFYINPVDAIRCWFRYQKDAPSDVNIMARNKDDAIKLVEAATPYLLTKLYSQYKCPYKLDWLISEAEKQVENGCKYFYEDSYGYGDSVHPFGVG